MNEKKTKCDTDRNKVRQQTQERETDMQSAAAADEYQEGCVHSLMMTLH